MTETMPEVPPHIRVISVVICPAGYQAMIEEREELAFHPYWRTTTRVARATSICQAIAAAFTGVRMKAHSTQGSPTEQSCSSVPQS